MNAHRSLLRLASVLTTVVLLGGCHEGDAVTDIRSSTPTPVANPLSGTWTGRFGSSTETFTATVSQEGTTVTVDWARTPFGTMRFVGDLQASQLRGHLTVEHDSISCPIRNAPLVGTANPSRIAVSGFALCKNYDVMGVSFELTR